MSVSHLTSSHRPLAMNPIKFALWLFIVSIIMFFAALTSAYIVKKSSGDWLEITLPMLFLYTMLLITLSSVSMQMALVYARKNFMNYVKILLIVTLCLGLLFVIGQYTAWQQLVRDQNVYLVGHPSGSFIYVISGAHVVHVLAGLIGLMTLCVQTFIHKVHSKSIQNIEICTTYWHFIGILWIYLYVFLLLTSKS